MKDDIQIQNRDAFAALRALESSSAHVAVLDYPWQMEGHDRTGANSNFHVEDWEMADNDRFPEALASVVDTLVDGGWLFVFADDDMLPEFREAVEEAATYRKTLIWDTKRIGMGHYFRSRHQYIIAATVGDTERFVRDVPTVLEAAAPQRQPGRADTYPTAKPVSLVHRLLAPVTERGERVIEPFCGSAPALEAAKALGLRYWGADISEDALQRARDRNRQMRLDTDSARGEPDG